MTPRDSIEAASSPSAASSKVWRGWPGSRSIEAVGISCTDPADAAAPLVIGASCATSPSKEESPRPRPVGRLRGGSALMRRRLPWAGGRPAREPAPYRLLILDTGDHRGGQAGRSSALRTGGHCVE